MSCVSIRREPGTPRHRCRPKRCATAHSPGWSWARTVKFSMLDATPVPGPTRSRMQSGCGTGTARSPVATGPPVGTTCTTATLAAVVTPRAPHPNQIHLVGPQPARRACRHGSRPGVGKCRGACSITHAYRHGDLPFSDVEGSTRLWEEHRSEMTTALARHDGVLRAAIESHAGYVFSTAGDGFSAAFATAGSAVAAAVVAQRALAAEPWPQGVNCVFAWGCMSGWPRNATAITSAPRSTGPLD